MCAERVDLVPRGEAGGGWNGLGSWGRSWAGLDTNDGWYCHSASEHVSVSHSSRGKSGLTQWVFCLSEMMGLVLGGVGEGVGGDRSTPWGKILCRSGCI